jgi:hypothetical protein
MPMPLDPVARRQVAELFDRALGVAPADRVVFLQRECEDTAIRNETLSLLAWHDRTDQFLESPAAQQMGQDPPVQVPPRPAGTIVGQYRIDGVLGQGGMGVVYRAEDLRLGRVVALKAVTSALTKDAARRERLRREARASAQFIHPGIATVFALEEFGEELFIAGEFVPGETLRDEIARGPLDAQRVLDTAIELAEALAAAHDHGIVHRDLKPENVMRLPSGRVKILDFGLATVRDVSPSAARLTSDGVILGTPAYMSPEQIRRDGMDGRSDLFSLGIVLFELLTGAHPFGSGNGATLLARILERPPAEFSVDPGNDRASSQIRRGLEALIRTLLQKAPSSRFASAHQLLAALQRVRAGGATATLPAGADDAAEARRWWRFHQIVTCVFYVAVLIPAWSARSTLGPRIGRPIFLVAVVAIVGAITLRLHFWFAAASLPGEWARQHASSWVWLRVADILLVVSLAALGLSVLQTDNVVAAVTLVICAVITLVSATIIEPATTRAAFERTPEG